MQAFIGEAAQRFGIDPAQVQKLAGGVLGTIEENAGDEEFAQIRGAVPGADEAMAAAAEKESGGGGLGGLGGIGGGLGGMLGKAASLAGGGGVAGLITQFTSAGLDTSQAGNFVQMFVDYLKKKAGAQVVEQVVSKVPGLGKLLG